MSNKKDQKNESAVVNVGNELKPSTKKDHDVKHWDTSSNNYMDVDSDKQVNNKGLSNDHKLAKDRKLDDNTHVMGKEGSCRKSKVVERNENVIEKRDQKNPRKLKTSQIPEGEPEVVQIDGKNEQKKKEKHIEKEVPVQEAEKPVKDERSKRKVAHLDIIDDKETSFAELVAYDATEIVNPPDKQRRGSQGVGKVDTFSALVTYPAKKKKSKNQGSKASVLQFLTPEVGLGGPSAWTD